MALPQYDLTVHDGYDEENDIQPYELNEAGGITVAGYALAPTAPHGSSAGIGINNPPIPLPGQPPTQEILYEPIVAPIAPPTAHFDVVAYIGYNVQFINESLGNVEFLEWDFGDGQTSTEEHPLHTYQTTGMFEVRLTVRNSGGETTFFRYVESISPAPVVDFEFAIGGFAVYFTNQSNTTEGLWDFGDGQTSTEKNPKHIYANTGSYIVTLKSGGISTQKTVNIDVEILLEWDDNSDNEAGFKIEHSLDGSTGWAEIADVGAGVTSYGVTMAKDGVSSDVVNFFRVLAYSGAGDSGYSNISNVRCG